MKRFLSILLTAVLVFSLAACGNNSAAQTETTSQENSEETTSVPVSEPSEDTEQTETASEPQSGSETSSNGSSTLVAYFSLAGEQYQVGVVEEGNTSIIAHMIAEQTGADLFEIEPVTPYPETYDGLLEISQQESADNARPEIAGTVENMDSYDTVFIGYPIWWGDMPAIVYHFLESYDLSGKTIVPFCTHGGSGLSGTESTIAEITGGTGVLS